MERKIGQSAAAFAAFSLCAASPAAAAGARPADPWVLLSAFAARASARELCKDSDAKERRQSPKQGQFGEEACALPVMPAAQAGPAGGVSARSAAAKAIDVIPLLAGVTALAGLTAYLVATDDQRRSPRRPISPE